MQLSEAISHQRATSEACVRSQVNICEIFVGRMTLGHIFLRLLLFSLVRILPPVLDTRFVTRHSYRSGAWELFYEEDCF